MLCIKNKFKVYAFLMFPFTTVTVVVSHVRDSIVFMLVNVLLISDRILEGKTHSHVPPMSARPHAFKKNLFELWLFLRKTQNQR